MKHCTLYVWLFGLLLGLPGLAQVAGTISDVTVYRGQALVTRQVDFNAAAGPQEVIVTPLPAGVVPESLYATGDGDLTIRAVRYRVTAVGEEPREEVRALDARIAEKQKALKAMAAKLGVLDNRSRYLDKLENFVAPTATAELSKGVLDPKALVETSTFIFTQRDEIAQQRLDLENEKAQVEQDVNTLSRERGNLMAGSSKTQREAVLLVDAPRARKAHCALSYLVNHVNWSPAYSAKLTKAHDKLSLEYHAVVNQMSGEDWANVKLTLSTTRPTMTADSPLLSPLWVSLVADGQAADRALPDYGDRVRELNQQLRDGYPTTVVSSNGGRAGAPGSPSIPAMPQDADETFSFFMAQNTLAGQLQQLELAADEETIRKTRKLGPEQSEGLAVSYALPGAVSLQSRSDQQMFRIAALELKADAYYTAVPLLTDYVYLAADAVNTSDFPLLPGPYNAYVDGGFAGRGWLPLVAMGQGMTVGFGTETQLRAVRELVDKTTEVRGGNQRVAYTYRLRLQNYMAQPVKVRLWDRLPQAQASQVTITLATLEPALSTDAFYLSEDRPHGLLRWDMDVPAQAAKTKAVEVKYQLQMEYDKNYHVGELPSGEMEEQMKKDFRLRLERGKR